MNRNRLVRIAITAFLVPAAALLLGSGAQAVPPSPYLTASIGTQISGHEVSSTTNSIASGTTFEGHLAWNFHLANDDPSNPVVTAPEISVASGYDASLFFAKGPSFPTTSFPFVVSQPSLAPYSGFGLGLGSSLPASMQVGCDTARSVDPPVVPPGGEQQTITFTIRCVDPNVHSVNGGMDLFPPCGNGDALCTGPTSFTVVSVVPPQNLDQGEQWDDFVVDQPVHLGFDLGNLVAGKQYTVALVVQTPNPFDVPIVWTPGMGLSEYVTQPSSCSVCSVPTSSLTIPVPSLDGPSPNAGAVTFSTGEPHTWDMNVVDQRDVGYGGTDGGGLNYAGPTSATAGQRVTLSAGWDPGGNMGLDGTPVTFTLGSQSCTGATSDGQASCTITLTQPVGSYTLKLFSPGDLSVYPTSASASFSITGPTSTNQCKNSGWRVFGIFKNQGDCVSYVATKGKNPPSG